MRHGIKGFSADWEFQPRSNCHLIGLAIMGVVEGGLAYAGSQSAGNAIAGATNQATAGETNAANSAEALLGPYRNLGQSAIPTLMGLLGLNANGSLNSTANTLAALQKTPGYQFTQQQGNMATKNAASASGILNSGNTLASLDKFNTGLADQIYQQAVDNATNTVNIGQNAAAGTGSIMTNTANNVGAQTISAGNAQAGIDANLAASLANIAGNSYNTYTLNNTLKSLNNPTGG